MSVHSLRRLSHVHPNVRVIVGWDAQLATFFTQVWQLPRHEGGLISNLVAEGIHPYEIDEAATALELARPYAHIPEGLHQQLLADRRDESDPTEGRLRTALVELKQAAAR
jgi:hypothetical protein